MKIDLTLSNDEIEKIIMALDFYTKLQIEVIKQGKQQDANFEMTENDFQIKSYMKMIDKLSLLVAHGQN